MGSGRVAVLEHAGLVTREAGGRERVCRLNPATLPDAQDWLEKLTELCAA